jgi:hypothetical protein
MATKERYEVFGQKCKSFKEATAKAVDSALESRESVAISVFEGQRLVAYINVTAALGD